MGRGAAFFDLDRTLLKGASGPLITEALQQAGIAPQRSLPGQGLLYRMFDLVGETLPSMALARAAAFIAKGWSAEAVRQAGKAAAEKLEDLVAPYARPLIQEHRDAGRPVVLATTTPYDLVSSLAERLAFDDVIATHYAEDAGIYTGRLEGEFVWANGKLSAVKRWAAEHDVDLADSYAYSDSIYDTPLLSAVGHPNAVNADARLLAMALVRRWPILNLDVPPGVPKLLGVEPFDVIRLTARPELFPYARFDIDGTDLIPDHGAAIIVANHRSYFDTAAVGITVIQGGRAPRFLGKKEVFDAPVIGPLAKALGGIRVDRGSGSGEPMDEAARALQAGEVVTLMPQGTIPRGRKFFEPVLEGRTGAARLAALTRAPVIPIGLWGTEHVWPRSSRLPNVTNIGNPPVVRTRVGRPVELQYDDARADTERIMQAIVDLLPPEARERYEPTAEEIKRATPAGKDPENPDG
ncbi:MAG TPA: HAD-IB family hydrolase [Acidimicrobiales bacterium]|nr:HAD-IB family hydrolase [Acidimicrobiales bacterium]